MLSSYSSIEITYIIPVYIENQKAQIIEKFVEQYEQYSPDILKKVLFVFVDDCSPIPVNINSKKLNFTLARINDDIKWNQGGARNLGVLLAKSSKLILTDLDHTFPEETLAYLLKAPLPKSLYNFNRLKDGQKHNIHPNTYYCTKSTFFKSLGVDEEFCGNYGYEDIYFLELQKSLKTKIKTIKRYPVWVREHKEHPSESHHLLIRDTKVNHELLHEKLKYLKSKDPFKGHSRLFLNFSWDIVEEQLLGQNPES
ncbi:glycosyltransferase family protein [Echinicola salinicaeni]|uniref:glycosyltransferase n=1 Tax=Echinicola salinicaeni TaxID=2762757 RepID=UPI001648E4B8|nr:glycosyltransferase [Echinicola salinicaeni]